MLLSLCAGLTYGFCVSAAFFLCAHAVSVGMALYKNSDPSLQRKGRGFDSRGHAEDGVKSDRFDLLPAEEEVHGREAKCAFFSLLPFPSGALLRAGYTPGDLEVCAEHLRHC